MNRILLLLIFLCIAFIVRAADANPRELFGLYPAAPTDKDGARAFSVQGALDGEDYPGFYREPAVLTLSHIAKVSTGYPEAGTIPFPALFLSFTNEGFKRLRDHLKLAEPSDLVVVIDGRAYATLPPRVIRDILDRRVDLRLLIRSALDNKDELDLLRKKLIAAKAPKKQ